MYHKIFSVPIVSCWNRFNIQYTSRTVSHLSMLVWNYHKCTRDTPSLTIIAHMYRASAPVHCVVVVCRWIQADFRCQGHVTPTSLPLSVDVIGLCRWRHHVAPVIWPASSGAAGYSILSTTRGSLTCLHSSRLLSRFCSSSILTLSAICLSLLGDIFGTMCRTHLKQNFLQALGQNFWKYW